MDAPPLTLGIAIGTAGGLVVLFWLLATGVFVARARLAAVHRQGRVVLILPLAGAPPRLDLLLRALAGQSLPPHRLIVAVEQGDAAAEAAVRAVPLPFPVEIVAAAPAPHRAQKCSNLLAGLGRLREGDEVAALLDADIRPQSWWLSTLASPVLAGAADLVSGYRWLQPGGGIVAQLAAWHDRTLAFLPRSARIPVAWGGSLALGPAALAEGAASRALESTLSDDLSLARMAAARGLRLLMRRILLLPTPIGGSPRALLGFLARQRRIVHLYLPVLWWTGALSSHCVLLFWVWLALTHPLFLPLLPACGAVRWALHDRVGRRVGAPDPPGTRIAQLLLALSPLPDLLDAWVAWASLFPRHVVWRHVTYHVAGPEEVRVLHRAPP